MPAGRSNERATRTDSALPIDDPAVDALTETERQVLSRSWQRRVKSELQVGLAFDALLAPASRVGASPTVLGLLVSAAKEEREHAAVCAALAARYSGRRLLAPALEDFEMPDFGEQDERAEFTMQLAGLCCVNETIATAWIRACKELATAPLAVAANRVHLRDEIDHARLGWAHVAAVREDPNLKRRLERRLPDLVAVNVRQWLDPARFVDTAALTSHGALDVYRSRVIILEATECLVLRGFAHLGFDVPTATALGF